MSVAPDDYLYLVNDHLYTKNITFCLQSLQPNIRKKGKPPQQQVQHGKSSTSDTGVFTGVWYLYDMLILFYSE